MITPEEKIDNVINKLHFETEEELLLYINYSIGDKETSLDKEYLESCLKILDRIRWKFYANRGKQIIDYVVTENFIDTILHEIYNECLLKEDYLGCQFLNKSSVFLKENILRAIKN